MPTFCPGDPAISLASLLHISSQQAVLVLGAHHEATSTASYVNVALSDPQQRLGLQVRHWYTALYGTHDASPICHLQFDTRAAGHTAPQRSFGVCTSSEAGGSHGAQSCAGALAHTHADSALWCARPLSYLRWRPFLDIPFPQAFDSTQLYGSAVPYLQGTPYEEQAKYLYAVMFARDCRTGTVRAKVTDRTPRCQRLCTLLC